MSEAIDDAIQVALNKNLWVPNDNWFDKLQDDGEDLTEKEMKEWKENPSKRKRTFITARGKHFPKLYKLAEMLYVLYYPHSNELFPKILKNRSDCIHKIGNYIATNRYSTARGDLHSHTESALKEYAAKEKYSQLPLLHYIEQRMVLKYFVEQWSGKTIADRMEFQDRDLLRVAGLLFHEELRDDIPFILPKPKIIGRAMLDSWPSKKKRLYHMLHVRFIDKEQKVVLPPKWNDDYTKSKIKERGMSWDDLTSKQFNPNDPVRIKLPWTENHIKSMIQKVITAYNKIMEDYTKDTGGGSGNVADVVSWREREDVHFANYNHKVKECLYMTVVHMWNKNYGYPFYAEKEEIPVHCQIDDDNGIQSSTPGTQSSKIKNNTFLDLCNLVCT